MSGPEDHAIVASPSCRLRGAFRPVGERSLTHSALILAAVASGDSRLIHANPCADSLRISGRGWLMAGNVSACGDHRIAVAAVVAGLAGDAPVVVDDARPISASDPTFIDRIVRIGGLIS